MIVEVRDSIQEKASTIFDRTSGREIAEIWSARYLVAVAEQSSTPMRGRDFFR